MEWKPTKNYDKLLIGTEPTKNDDKSAAMDWRRNVNNVGIDDFWITMYYSTQVRYKNNDFLLYLTLFEEMNPAAMFVVDQLQENIEENGYAM